MRYGYARVSRDDQDLGRQIQALRDAGIADDCIHTEHMSGAKAKPEREKLLARVKSGDVIIVQKFDRFGRGFLDLATQIERFVREDIRFISLTDGFDLATSHGRMLARIFAAIAENERETISERTKNALAYIKSQGKVLGKRPQDLSSQVSRFREIEAAGGDPRVEFSELSSHTYYKIRRAARSKAE